MIIENRPQWSDVLQHGGGRENGGLGVAGQDVECRVFIIGDARETDVAVHVVDGDFGLALHDDGEGLRGDVLQEVAEHSGMDAEADGLSGGEVALHEFGGGAHHVLAVGGDDLEDVAIYLKKAVVEDGEGSLAVHHL